MTSVIISRDRGSCGRRLQGERTAGHQGSVVPESDTRYYHSDQDPKDKRQTVTS